MIGLDVYKDAILSLNRCVAAGVLTVVRGYPQTAFYLPIHTTDSVFPEPTFFTGEDVYY